MSQNLRIAVIGAGLSGLVLASKLGKIAKVKVFEKSRGVGGRMASRLIKKNDLSESVISDDLSAKQNQDFHHDFGAQFFNAKSAEFKEFLQPFIDRGMVVKWLANFVEIDGNKIINQRFWDGKPEHYVVNPKMSSICKELAKDLEVELQTKISRVQITKNSVFLNDDKDKTLGEFDLAVIAIPAVQAFEILPKFHQFRIQIARKKMVGCFVVMLNLAEDLPVEWDVAYLKNSKLSWIAKEGSKPHKNGSKAVTFLSRNAWAEVNLERDINEVKEELLMELSYATNCDLPKILHSDIHRWRYANIKKQEGEANFLFDPKSRIAVCGDWFIRGRIEAAFTSGNNLASAIMQNLK